MAVAVGCAAARRPCRATCVASRPSDAAEKERSAQSEKKASTKPSSAARTIASSSCAPLCPSSTAVVRLPDARSVSTSNVWIHSCERTTKKSVCTHARPGGSGRPLSQQLREQVEGRVVAAQPRPEVVQPVDQHHCCEPRGTSGHAERGGEEEQEGYLHRRRPPDGGRQRASAGPDPEE
eukprot:scaffold31618_cov63-Phaeocystis_antarctica.AAC.3